MYIFLSFRFSKKVGEGASNMGKGMMSKLNVFFPHTILFLGNG